MRKSTKYLVLAGMAIISGICAFAQNPKQCNLMLTLTTPTDGTVVNYGDPIDIKFDIMNMGPDAIAATDTIFYSFPTGDILYKTGVAIANMGSTTVDLGPALQNTNTSGTDQPANLCITLEAQSNITVNGNPVGVTYNDSDSTNDRDCNSITLKADPTPPPPPVGIFEVKTEKGALNLYPNPATDKVMFDIALENPETAIAVIRDVTGREVMQKDFGKVQTGTSTPLELNITSLNAGIYIVEVTAGDKKFIGKVTKQN